MDARKEQAVGLVSRWLEHQCTGEEERELFELLIAERALLDEVFSEVVTSLPQDAPALEADVKRMILESIYSATATERTQPRVHRMHFMRSSFVRIAAAAILVFCTVGGWYFMQHRSDDKTLATTTQQFKGDVAPGKTGAVLKFDNGESIMLDTAGNGQVRQGFDKSNEVLAVNNASVEYATVETPKGRTMSVKLADGSQVWLNAGSSLRFPTAFNGKTREVEMTGECYFEVRHNEKQPFRVKVNGEIIEDIGTAFNVNAYADEAGMKTTLSEGVVKIRTFILQPGEQYQNGKVSEGNVEQALAWKNGMFSFERSDVQTVMRSIARWYDVEVKYEGRVNETFTGKIGRDLTLAQVLEILQETRLHFRIEEDKRVVIYP